MPKERILIVEDETNIASSIKGILADEGYEVTATGDGLDALEQIQADPPDLLVLDIWLPGMDGIEVLKTVKTYHPEIEVLVMSGHATIDTAVQATKLGAFDFIEKPFTLDHLTQSVENVFKQKKKKSGPSHQDILQKLELPLGFEAMVEVKKAIKNNTRNNKPVLVLGEKGTGKEFIAQAIHSQSRKADRPFIKLNCAVRQMQDIQNHLFLPRSKGRASTRQSSRAAGKAVFLRNVDALSKGLQDKLAAYFSADTEKKQELKLEFIPDRLFASSSEDLEALAAAGRFNPDLLEIFRESTLDVPPLREYCLNIPTMIKDYFEQNSPKTGGSLPEIEPEVIDALCNYSWPENIKELKTVLDKALVSSLARGKITLQDLPSRIRKLRSASSSAPAIGLSERPPETSPNRYPQRTLKRSVVLCGSGLHSGIKTGLILQPLPPGSGIIFGDISSGQTIPARLENVQSTDYSTCLKKGSAAVGTIEHIMACLHMYRITNLLIKIGDEAPVMDGSAKDFCQLIEDGEFEDQDDYYDAIVIDRPYSFGGENGKPGITVEPCDTFKVSYHMEYPAPIGVLDHTFEYRGHESFKKEIAPARTFGFMEDVAQLTKMGFASGGKLDNFILLGDGKVLNTQLRFPDEFARHKILDIIGDFYLLGRPIQGHIRAYKSGHTQNIGLMKTFSSARLGSVA
ncbi:MAG: UDP-3-O-[3-hydroxymyristoyl] N-acetylglucosamine deacetylase [Nitrospinae bacterium CG11_big_fil_rev_8_21_14_0_20_56_8]|nr:MAG: UDP-3-O-[3-hydroxymyristoyl] N-acetylglucosamine deacetylase [Nitrospinae bacterium CG11_big_fil_rev_8_21_14_0_20_56_8]